MQTRRKDFAYAFQQIFIGRRYAKEGTEKGDLNVEKELRVGDWEKYRFILKEAR